MYRTICALSVLAAALTGCQRTGPAVTKESYRASYYAKCTASARRSMVASAQADGARAAAKVCGCTADAITRDASANDLAAMPNERIMTAGRACVTKLYPRAARRMTG